MINEAKLSSEDLKRKALKMLALTQSTIDNESTRSTEALTKLVKDNCDREVIPYLASLFADITRTQQNDNSEVEALIRSANAWKAEAGRLEVDLTRYSKEMMKLKAENTRLRKDNRLLQSLSPKHQLIASYGSTLESWVRKSCVFGEESWSSSAGLHDFFEQTYPSLAKLGVTLTKFSLLFKEISGLNSVKGGPLLQNMGFRVAVRRSERESLEAARKAKKSVKGKSAVKRAVR